MFTVIINPARRNFHPYTFFDIMAAIDFAIFWGGWVENSDGKILYKYNELPFNA